MAIVLLLTWTENVDLDVKYSMVEYFSGQGNVSFMFRRAGRRVANFELKDSRAMNMNTSAGFASLASIAIACKIN